MGTFSDDEERLQTGEMNRVVDSVEHSREAKEEEDEDDKWKITLRRGGDRLHL